MRFPDDYPLIVGHENRGAEIIVEIIVHSIAGDVNHGQAGLIYVKIFFSKNAVRGDGDGHTIMRLYHVLLNSDSRLPQAYCALCGLKSPVAKINLQIGRHPICQSASFK